MDTALFCNFSVCKTTLRDKQKFFVKLLYTKVCEGLGRGAPTHQRIIFYKKVKRQYPFLMLPHVQCAARCAGSLYTKKKCRLLPAFALDVRVR